MKKLYFTIIAFFFLIIPWPVLAFQEGITSFYIDATVHNNGDVNVKELIVLNGDFNGFNRIINYKNNLLSKFDGTVASFKGSDIYNGSGIELVSIKNIDVNNNNFDLIYSAGDEFSEVSSADVGDYGKYIITTKNNGITYKIFNPSDGEERGFYIEYNITNIGVVHNDVAEVYMNLFDQLTEFVNNLEMRIHIPNNKELLRGWAHGPLTGEIEIENNQLIKVTASNVNINTPIDVRFAFDSLVLSNSTKKSGVDGLNKIVKVETERADIANKEREEAMKVLVNQAEMAVKEAEERPTRDNYDYAIVSINYLPTGDAKTSLLNRLSIVLENVEKDEKNIQRIITLLLVGWLIGLVFIIINFYKKYDKEHDPSFKGDYYRDFPANYGPEIVGYLFNKNVGNNDLSACLMNLIYKKAVLYEEKITDKNKKTYLLTPNTEGMELTLQEHQLINFMLGNGAITLEEIQKKAKKNYESFISGYSTWKNITLEAGKSESFFEINTSKKALCILYSILGIILSFIGFSEYIGNISLALILLLLSIISLIYFASSSKRSIKGNNDYKKWLGLKKFLQDFSNMDKRELPEVVLWEKYLVYALPLGCAKKLSKDMEIRIKEFNNAGLYDGMYDMGYFNRMLLINNIINNSVISTVSVAYAEKSRQQMSDIASSSHSSGGGFGGGFSSGGGFGGGGGGGGRF